MDSYEQEPLPGVSRRDFMPGAVLVALLVAAYVLTLGDMALWGISQRAMDEGRWWTIIANMFAHGSLPHLALNSLILFFVSGPVIARLGAGPAAYWRYGLLFLACGLGGSIAYLLINPFGMIPAVGASGAVFGFVGLLARLPRSHGPVAAEHYQRVRPLTGDLVLRTAFLLAIISVPGILSPGFMGIAWEAHLGGFLVGFLLGPLLLPR